ncbi:hypothetical protein K3495_g3654 [Podosphaera aphanis]|nr:hypothetical protein K3495_g3654 [Podosphaera aphanis]
MLQADTHPASLPHCSLAAPKLKTHSQPHQQQREHSKELSLEERTRASAEKSDGSVRKAVASRERVDDLEIRYK